MKEEIEEIKKLNGNINYGTRDLVWYVIHKVDRIDDKLDKKLDRKTFWKVLGSIGTIILIFIGVLQLL